ncbi:MAG: recombinase RecT [Coprococcus sp.]|nr:MAG TPA: RecT protein [Caudoviricetes sp.]
MAVNNSLVAKSKAQQNLGITTYLAQDAVKNQINQVIGGKNGQRFISAIVSAYNTNPTLQECTNQSILSAALLGESLQLSPSPQLGHYYMVPFNNTKAGTKEAQFQMGYKGYIQLAIRSGQYKRLNVVAIKEGELEYFDPLNEDIKVNLMVDDWDKREEAETIGYYAMFELVNGFRKTMYWSKAQMLAHADKYSPAFYKDAGKVKTKYGEKQRVSFADYEAGNYDPRDSWMYSSFWYKNFDGMAYKTMLRQLISKWGVMSIDLQKAFEGDMATLDAEGHPTYVENDNDEYVEATATEVNEPQDPQPEPQDAQNTQNTQNSAQDPQPAPAENPQPEPQQMNAAEAALFGSFK